MAEIHLGDGLYARREPDGTVELRAPRGDGDHYVVLEPRVLEAFDRWRGAASDLAPEDVEALRAVRWDVAEFGVLPEDDKFQRDKQYCVDLRRRALATLDKVLGKERP